MSLSFWSCHLMAVPSEFVGGYHRTVVRSMFAYLRKGVRTQVSASFSTRDF